MTETTTNHTDITSELARPLVPLDEDAQRTQERLMRDEPAHPGSNRLFVARRLIRE